MKNTEFLKSWRGWRDAGGIPTICKIAVITLLINQSAGAQEVSRASSDKPTNVIIFIADGLGFAQLSLVMQMHAGQALWQRFTATGWHQPSPLGGYLTDSAASATAIATGTTTLNGAIGVDENGTPLQNIFELASENGYRTGVVTDSYVWDATPAGFTVHSESRENAAEILQALSGSSLDVLLGELEKVGDDDVPDQQATEALFEARFSLLDATASDADSYAGEPIAGLFRENQIEGQSSEPTLQHLTAVALDALTHYSEPFLLLLETEELDSAGHWANEKRLENGLSAMQDTVAVVFDFLEQYPDTLFVFTSDHETGGLVLKSNSKNLRVKPKFNTLKHTGSVVPVLAVGPGDSNFIGIHTNSGLGQLLKSLIH